MTRGEFVEIMLRVLKANDLVNLAAITSKDEKDAEIGVEAKDGSRFFIVVEEV